MSGMPQGGGVLINLLLGLHPKKTSLISFTLFSASPPAFIAVLQLQDIPLENGDFLFVWENVVSITRRAEGLCSTNTKASMNGA